jgi:FkbM family methyltransferase
LVSSAAFGAIADDEGVVWPMKLKPCERDMKTAVIVGQNYPDEMLAGIVAMHDRVLIFEPLPQAAEACRVAYRGNPKAIVFEAACGEAFSNATLNIYNENGLSSSLGEITTQSQDVYSSFDLRLTGRTLVRVVNLRDILATLGIEFVDLLVIDAQGMDFAILKTLELYVQGSRIGFIQVEADGKGCKHYEGVPDNSESGILSWMGKYPQYAQTRHPDRIAEQPDLVFILKDS